MTTLEFSFGATRFAADTRQGFDLSIPLDFDGPQPQFFGAPAAVREVLESRAGFIGDTRRGGSCNCESYRLTPHCNGTHTECVGHITEDRVALRDVLRSVVVPAELVTVTPQSGASAAGLAGRAPGPHDKVITQAMLAGALCARSGPAAAALILRTLPNDDSKLRRHYDDESAAYFTPSAMHHIVQRAVMHLLVDLPSLDRTDDGGALEAHRIFWGLPPGSRSLADATRPGASVTEMIYAPGSIPDGLYLLDLQIPPFVADAAPSRPLLYPVVEA